MASKPKNTKRNGLFPKSVRRYTIEKSPTCGTVYPHPIQNCNCLNGCAHTTRPHTPTKEEECRENLEEQNQKYVTPRLNSALHQINQIEALQMQQPVQYKTTSDLTPRSKAVIAPKITQKLNFNTSRTVFKNLLPINVNDSVLLQKKTASIGKKYVKTANKAPAPELCDFLDPLPVLHHTIPEPEIDQEFSQQHFSYFEAYLRLYD